MYICVEVIVSWIFYCCKDFEDILEVGKLDFAISVLKVFIWFFTFLLGTETLSGFSVLHMYFYLAVGKLYFLSPKGVSCVCGKIQNRSEKYLRLPNLLLTFHFSHYLSCHINSPAVLPLPYSNTIYLKS